MMGVTQQGAGERGTEEVLPLLESRPLFLAVVFVAIAITVVIALVRRRR